MILKINIFLSNSIYVIEDYDFSVNILWIINAHCYEVTLSLEVSTMTWIYAGEGGGMLSST
jgi:hypothetical protein